MPKSWTKSMVAWKSGATGLRRTCARCRIPTAGRGCASRGMVERTSVTGETQTVEQRYFINSIRANAQRFAHGVRGNWGIENRLHWRLDVVFGDDASGIRKGNAPAIMTSIRHLCVNLFDQEPSS
jgi:predicted transposase YbfD/YdcC